MRISSILPFLLAIAPAVTARGTLGFSLGDKKNDGHCKEKKDYLKDFAKLKDLSSLVRTYSGSECDTPKHVLPAAADSGFKVVLGIW